MTKRLIALSSSLGSIRIDDVVPLSQQPMIPEYKKGQRQLGDTGVRLSMDC